MKKYMILESEQITQADIDAAIKRASQMRSAYAWQGVAKVSSKLSKLFHMNGTEGSGLAHSS